MTDRPDIAEDEQSGHSSILAQNRPMAHRHAEISFPVSRRLMVLLTRNVVTGRPRCLSHDELQEYNRRTIVMSDKYLYSTTVTQELRNLVSKNASESAEWKTTTIRRGRGAAVATRFVPVRQAT